MLHALYWHGEEEAPGALYTHEMETAFVSVGASRSNSPPSFLTASGTVKLFVSVASLKYGFFALSKVKVMSYSRGSEVE